MDTSASGDTQSLQWEFAHALGEGAYGEVKLAINAKSGETRAVKIISLNLVNDKTIIQKEILIQKTLNHENIVKFYSSFQQLDKYYIIMEYCSGGELFDRIEPDYGMPRDLAHKYFRQLLNGVEYIHSKGIVHRDLKPENLLLNENDVLKIADFGLATLYQYKGNERLLTSPCGTAPYVATEVLSKGEYRAQPTDVWSCGIILIAMLAGELPWDKPVIENKDFYNWVNNDCYQHTPWCKLENSVLALLKKMLCVDPEQRFTLRQVKSSTWYMRPPVNEDRMMSQNSTSMYLSQPTYCYSSDLDRASTTASIEMQITESNEDCDCVSQMDTHDFYTHIQSFSQPISTDSMILNSQIQNTQNASSQITQSQAQSPLLRMVKRMTRMFVHTNLDQTVEELKKVFQKFMYDYKVVSIASQRQRQITVSTIDKRQMPLTFKVNLLEMNTLHNDALVDFRLSKGDGLEFKKIFLKIKSSLSHIACKKYVFANPFTQSVCCDRN